MELQIAILSPEAVTGALAAEKTAEVPRDHWKAMMISEHNYLTAVVDISVPESQTPLRVNEGHQGFSTKRKISTTAITTMQEVVALI